MFSIVWIVGNCADLACKHNLMLSSLPRLPFTTIPAWFWKYRLCLWDKGVLAGRHKLFHQKWKTTKTYSLHESTPTRQAFFTDHSDHMETSSFFPTPRSMLL